MANGITIGIGGKLLPSYGGALSGAEREAKLSVKRIDAELARATSPGYINSLNRAKAQIQNYENRQTRDDIIRGHAEIRRAEAERVSAMFQSWNVNGKGGPKSIGKGWGGATSAMFVSVMRDSAASLASGANPLTVFMQQAPQVLQALTMMKSGVQEFVISILKMPLTWSIAGLVAFAGAVFLVARHFIAVEQRQKNFKEALDLSNRSLQDQSRLLTESIAAHREYLDWLHKQVQAQEDVKTATDAALHALREKHRYELEIARKGSRNTAAMEIQQMKAELALLNDAVDRARIAKHDAAIAAEEADKRQQAFLTGKGPNSAAALVEAKDKEGLWAKIGDAIKEKMKTATTGTGVMRSVGLYQYQEQRPVNADDKLTVKVGDKEYTTSLNEATGNMQSIQAKRTELEKVEKDLATMSSDTRTMSDQQRQQFNSLVGQRDQLLTDLGLKEKYGAAASGGRAHGNISESGLERSGVFANAGAARAHDTLREQLKELKHINRNTTGLGGRGRGSTRF